MKTNEQIREEIIDALDAIVPNDDKTSFLVAYAYRDDDNNTDIYHSVQGSINDLVVMLAESMYKDENLRTAIMILADKYKAFSLMRSAF